MPTRVTEEDPSALIQELLDEIESVRIGESWDLPLEFVLGLLGLSREEFFRYIYSRRDRGGWTDQLADGFGPHNTRELVEFLMNEGVAQAPREFHRAGYYFNEDHLLHWLEFFHSVSLARMQSREIDEELLETAVSGCRYFSDAVDFYVHASFDPEEFIAFAAERFLEHYGVEAHHASRSILGAYAREQIRQRNIIWEDLSKTALRDMLRRRAVDLGLIDEQDAEEERLRYVLMPDELKEALQVLELPADRVPEPEQLKKHYRELLKKYHPDVNPQGQEKTRAIIAAYNTAATQLAA